MKKLTVNQIDEISNLARNEAKNANISLSELKNKLEEGDLILNPDYQRNYILDPKEASKFVESIFIGCVIPEVQFFSFKDDLYEVIDGQQRLTSLIEFLKNSYCLIGLEELPELNGFYFKDFPKSIQRKLKNYYIHARISCDTEKIDKYKIFIRLNKGSKTLKPQEIKNCIYTGNLMDKIKEISNLELVKEMIPLDNIRMDRDEMVLRILSFSYCYNQKWSTSSQCTIMFLEEYKNADDKLLKEFEEEVLLTLTKMKEILGLNVFFNTTTVINHFTKKEDNKQKFIKTLFESAYIAISKYDIEKLRCNSSKIQIEMMFCKEMSEEFLKTMYTGSNARKNIINRINILSSIIEKNIT